MIHFLLFLLLSFFACVFVFGLVPLCFASMVWWWRRSHPLWVGSKCWRLRWRVTSCTDTNPWQMNSPTRWKSFRRGCTRTDGLPPTHTGHFKGKKAIRWEVHLYRGRVCLLGRRERLASGVAVPFSYFYFTVFRKMKKTNKRNKTKQKKTKSVYYELMMHVLYEKNLLWVRQIFFCCLCQICFVCLRVCSVLGV